LRRSWWRWPGRCRSKARSRNPEKLPRKGISFDVSHYKNSRVTHRGAFWLTDAVSQPTGCGTAILEPSAAFFSLGYNRCCCEPCGTGSTASKAVALFQKGQSGSSCSAPYWNMGGAASSTYVIDNKQLKWCPEGDLNPTRCYSLRISSPFLGVLQGAARSRNRSHIVLI
jgi:hypothetical protein